MRCDETVCVSDDPNRLAEKAADIFVADSGRSVDQRGVFAVALSGGTTPRGMHRRLVTAPWLAGIPWSHTHFFWVDDRCVPPESRESNYGTAKRDFLNDAPISPDQIHGMTCRLSPLTAAEKYQDRLLAFFTDAKMTVPRFDLIFLGLGEDGHTASLFPGQSSLVEQEKLVVATRGGNPDVDRISMTFSLLNLARHVVFLVSGLEKSRVTRMVLTQPGIHLPAQAIRPSGGRLTWLLDRAAASLLPADFQPCSIDV